MDIFCFDTSDENADPHIRSRVVAFSNLLAMYFSVDGSCEAKVVRAKHLGKNERKRVHNNEVIILSVCVWGIIELFIGEFEGYCGGLLWKCNSN